MKKKYDVLLKIIKGMVPLWNIMIFCYVWALYYNERTFSDFWMQTMLISFFLYFVIYMAFGKLYHAFKIGTYKISELIFSQLLTFGIADLCLYLECCLIHRGFVDIRPGIVAVLLQLIGSTILIVVAKRYFAKYIPPQKTILIYGGNKAEALEFEQKLSDKLSHMFQIQEMLNDSIPKEELISRINDYGTVLLYQVSESVRVELLAESIQKGKNIYITPRIEDILLTNFENRHIIDTPLLKAKTDCSEYYGKRILDILISSCMLLLFSPIMLLVALSIKIEDGGPVFFKQKRVTKDGKVFEILKFRSMIPDAEKAGCQPCTTNDSRITKTGHIIRATRLDELPQLINILKGDISIVGPRPIVEKETAIYGDDIAKLLSVKPGLTGYWQAYARNNATYASGERQKMEMYYVDNQSLWLDIKILFKTVESVLKREGAQ